MKPRANIVAFPGGRRVAVQPHSPQEPTREEIEQRCIERLRRLGADQIQIAEVVIAAIVRGGAA